MNMHQTIDLDVKYAVMHHMHAGMLKCTDDDLTYNYAISPTVTLHVLDHSQPPSFSTTH